MRFHRPFWLVELSNQLDQLRQELGDEPIKRIDQELTWQDIEHRIIKKVLSKSGTARSLVIFTNFVDDLLIELPQAVETTLHYGEPSIKPLLAQQSRHEKYLVALLSNNRHRVISIETRVTRGEALINTCSHPEVLLAPFTAQGDGLVAEIQAVNDAAREITAFFKADLRYDRIVLGGDLKMAYRVKAKMLAFLAEEQVSVEPIPMDATNLQLEKSVKLLANVYEELNDITLIQELLVRRETDGRGLLGEANVLEALDESKVRVIYLAYPTLLKGMDQIASQALQANVNVELVHGRAADILNAQGGVGALLCHMELSAGEGKDTSEVQNAAND